MNSEQISNKQFLPAASGTITWLVLDKGNEYFSHMCTQRCVTLSLSCDLFCDWVTGAFCVIFVVRTKPCLLVP
jgi:hypothetical protein